MTIQEKCQAVRTAMNALSALIDAETSALRKGHLKQAIQGHAAKMGAAVTLQDALSGLRGDLKSATALPEAAKRDIRLRQQALSASMENNMRALRDVQTASDRLSRLIVTTMRQAALEKSLLPARNKPLSIRCNQTV